MAKTYIDGTSCKAISGQFGEFFNISFNYEKLEQYANEKGYINMTMSKRREPGQYGDTHYFVLNEYNPENNSTQSSEPISNNSEPKNNSDDEISITDVPF